MYKWLFRTGRNLAILIILTVLVAQGISRFDSYRFAEDKITSILQSNPGFEDQLIAYSDVASQWKDFVKPEIAQSIINLGIDPLKSLEVWDDLLKLAGTVPGGRAFLENVDKLTHTIVSLTESLDKVAQAPTTAADFRSLRNKDNFLGRERLRQIYDNSSSLAEGLNGVSQGLRTASDYIRKVTDTPQRPEILKKLDEARAFAPPGVLQDLSDDLYRGIEAWSEMPNILDSIQEKIDADVKTLNSIRSWYKFAEIVDTALDYLYIRSMAEWINSRLGVLLEILTICIAVSVGGLAGSFCIEQVRWRRLTRPKIVVVDRGSKSKISRQSDKPRTRRPSKKIQRTQQEQPTAVNVLNITHEGEQISIMCNWANGRRETLQLPHTGKVTVGSSPTDEVQTNKSTSAKSQVLIKRGRTRYYLEVLDNTFPTILNGQLIVDARSVKNGDVLQVGDVIAVFLI